MSTVIPPALGLSTAYSDAAVTGTPPADTPASADASAGKATDRNAFRTATLTRRSALGIGSAVALAVAGCSSGDPKATTKTLDKVTYMTAFGTFGREGYIYVAKEKGFFRDAGIEVTVVPGAGQEADAQALVANKHQFMSTDSTQALTEMATWGLDKLRLIGVIHQRTVVAIMALKESGITQPRDLQDKKIAYGGQAPKILYPAYARLASFQPNRTTWQATTPQLLPSLLASGKVDAIGQFVTGLPAIKKAATGHEVVVLPFGDYMSDLFGNVVMTSADMLKNKPDLVKRFLGALLKGLSYAVNNPEEAGQITNKAVATTPAAVATAELQVMKPYVTGPGTLGVFEEDRVARALALLEGISVIPQGKLTPEKVVDFTVAPKS